MERASLGHSALRARVAKGTEARRRLHAPSVTVTQEVQTRGRTQQAHCLLRLPSLSSHKPWIFKLTQLDSLIRFITDEVYNKVLFLHITFAPQHDAFSFTIAFSDTTTTISEHRSHQTIAYPQPFLQAFVNAGTGNYIWCCCGSDRSPEGMVSESAESLLLTSASGFSVPPASCGTMSPGLGAKMADVTTALWAMEHREQMAR